jgi:hypothetical protein
MSVADLGNGLEFRIDNGTPAVATKGQLLYS